MFPESSAPTLPAIPSSIAVRSVCSDAFQILCQHDVNALLARLYASRGVTSPLELDNRLSSLHPFHDMLGCDLAARRLSEAVFKQEKILIIADYDADGATACAVAWRGLNTLGACVDFLVPDRFRFGYGLTPELVDVAWQIHQPRLLLTVDNGISSAEAVAHAQTYGMDAIVTDHHLPGQELPECIIVNPNQPGCPFPSKSIAGVGVIFYVLLALRAYLREQSYFVNRREPNLACLLDLVALGTVADVVRLDHNNRILVAQGLARIRAGHMQTGLAALFQQARRDPVKASVFDLGFVLGPRLNAAGRLDDMSIGIVCLINDDFARAAMFAQQLGELNAQRRHIEQTLQDDLLESLSQNFSPQCHSICVFAPDGHHGVIGIVASRLKERFHRPVMVFAPSEQGDLRVSGRSIPGFHLRDALDKIHKLHPGLLLRFGGHAAAAGASVRQDGFELFAQAFERVAQEELDEHQLRRTWQVDGALQAQELDVYHASLLHQHVWGQGFAPPLFFDEMHIVQQRLVGGGEHLKLRVVLQGQELDAMIFRRNQFLTQRYIQACYQVSLNVWRGVQKTDIIIEHINSE